MFPEAVANARHWKAVANVARFVGRLEPSHAVTHIELDATGNLTAWMIEDLARPIVSQVRGFIGLYADPIEVRSMCILRAIRWPELFARGDS